MSNAERAVPSVLLVEDTEAHVELIQRAFQVHASPLRLTTAGDLESARAILDRETPDLVIADLLLPDGKGTELLPQGDQPAGYPVLVLTSFGSERLAVEAMKQGALDYVAKSDVLFRDLPHIALRAIRQWDDMIKRKQVEEKLRQRELELAHVARLTSMGTMVAEVAHELGQPLFSIINFTKAGMLRLDGVDFAEKQEIANYLSRIHDTANKAGQILSRLRRFTRASSSGVSSFDLDELIAESLTLLEYDSRRRGISVVVETTTPGLTASADYVLLQQVLVNLLKNAFEALEDVVDRPRRVTVRTLAEKEKARVEVEDNGNGFEHSADELFAAFVTTKSQGMGLGLAISRDIVESHGGVMEARCRPGDGSVFGFTVPLATS